MKKEYFSPKILSLKKLDKLINTVLAQSAPTTTAGEQPLATQETV